MLHLSSGALAAPPYGRRRLPKRRIWAVLLPRGPAASRPARRRRAFSAPVWPHGPHGPCTLAPWPSRFQQGRRRPIPSHSESFRVMKTRRSHRGQASRRACSEPAQRRVSWKAAAHTTSPAIRAPSLLSSPGRRQPPDPPQRRHISPGPCGPGPTYQARRAVQPGTASPTGPRGISQDADAHPDGVGSGPRPRRSDVDAKREGDARH